MRVLYKLNKLLIRYLIALVRAAPILTLLILIHAFLLYVLILVLINLIILLLRVEVWMRSMLMEVLAFSLFLLLRHFMYGLLLQQAWIVHNLMGELRVLRVFAKGAILCGLATTFQSGEIIIHKHASSIMYHSLSSLLFALLFGFTTGLSASVQIGLRLIVLVILGWYLRFYLFNSNCCFS